MTDYPAPPDDRRADIEAFVGEQVDDLDLPPALDADLRSRIRDRALADLEAGEPTDRPAPTPAR